jgi:hypothetical protein
MLKLKSGISKNAHISATSNVTILSTRLVPPFVEDFLLLRLEPLTPLTIHETIRPSFLRADRRIMAIIATTHFEVLS